MYFEMEEMLDDDMAARVPGTFMSRDASFRLAGRTSNPDIEALTFSLAGDSTCHGWWATSSDNEAQLYPAELRLKRRLLRLNAEHLLRFVYTDTCCNGRLDLEDHTFVRLYSNVVRAPRGDGFHGSQGVNSTFNPAANNATKAQMSKKCGEVFRYSQSQFSMEHDVEPIIEWLTTRPRAPLSRSDALKKALSSDYAINRRTIGREPAELCRALQEFEQQLHLMDEEARHRGERPLIKPPTLWGGAGTVETIKCKLACCLKGCFSDPLPVEDMFLTIPAGAVGPGAETGLSRHYSRSQTTKNETLHRLLNRLVEGISNITPELLGARIKLRIYQYNDDRDVTLGRRSRHLSVPFWRRVQLEARARGTIGGSLGLMASTPVPRQPEKQREIFGFDYFLAIQQRGVGTIRAEVESSLKQSTDDEALYDSVKSHLGETQRSSIELLLPDGNVSDDVREKLREIARRASNNNNEASTDVFGELDAAVLAAGRRGGGEGRGNARHRKYAAQKSSSDDMTLGAAISPETTDEVELAISAVNQALAAKLKARALYADAASFFNRAYLMNCYSRGRDADSAAPLNLRSTTTAGLLQDFIQAASKSARQQSNTELLAAADSQEEGEEEEEEGEEETSSVSHRLHPLAEAVHRSGTPARSTTTISVRRSTAATIPPSSSSEASSRAALLPPPLPPAATTLPIPPSSSTELSLIAPVAASRRKRVRPAEEAANDHVHVRREPLNASMVGDLTAPLAKRYARLTFKTKRQHHNIEQFKTVLREYFQEQPPGHSLRAPP
jgi:hypothetical protein